MQSFYHKALSWLLGMVAASVLIGYVCFRCAHTSFSLLPAAHSKLMWEGGTFNDNSQGGHSTIELHDATSALDFAYTLRKGASFPFAKAQILFRDREGKDTLVDLSRYSTISFDVKCAPANTLAFGMLTFQDKVSRVGRFETYRYPYGYFFCDEHGGHVELDLSRLRTDQWWFDAYKLNLSRQDHTWDKVAEISFGTTFQSPHEAESRVQIENISLLGRDLRYLYLFAAFILIAWPAYGFWFFRRHTQALRIEVTDKVRRDLPLVAYQQLSQDLHRDKEHGAILRFMATEYVNPDLDVEAMVNKLGISHQRINGILKVELGYTFSTYLNKLRLTEAARLLAEKEASSVAEIAYSVGYRNVSYFNKLFKEEYACTPKMFRKLRDSALADTVVKNHAALGGFYRPFGRSHCGDIGPRFVK
jgi:AraC-like DNA-binding protein